MTHLQSTRKDGLSIFTDSFSQDKLTTSIYKQPDCTADVESLLAEHFTSGSLSPLTLSAFTFKQDKFSDIVYAQVDHSNVNHWRDALMGWIACGFSH